MKLDGSLRPVSRTTLADDIFNQLLRLMDNGKLIPGEKLPPERELAEKFGVGRSTVREALRALSMIGILEAQPGNGTFVVESPVSSFLSPFILGDDVAKENVPHLMEARLFLEVKLAALATERGSDEERSLIQQCFDDMLDSEDDPTRYLSENWNFHRAIGQAAHNSYLFQMFLMLRYLVQQWVNQPVSKYLSLVSEKRDLSLISQEHKMILDAILGRDVDAARRAMQDHLEKSGKRLLEYIQTEK